MIPIRKILNPDADHTRQAISSSVLLLTITITTKNLHTHIQH